MCSVGLGLGAFGSSRWKNMVTEIMFPTHGEIVYASFV